MGAVDPRVTEYARLIVERSLDVQPGWQVLIRTQPDAQPLIDELIGMIAARSAYPLLRMNYTLFPCDEPWAAEAPAELVGEIAPIDRYACDHMDARITVEAPDNTRGVAEVGAERRALMKQAAAPFFRRTMADEIPWVGCQFPTNALAQEAGMPLAAFEDFVYGACLRDWDAESQGMHRLLARFDAADEVRVVGDETDLRLSLAGRAGVVDDGRVNLPGGEFFFAPVEDSAEGTIYIDVPSAFEGAPVSGVRLRFGRAGSKRRRRSRARPSCSQRSTSTKGRASPGSWGSAATAAITGRCGAPSSTRRWPGPSTSRSAPATRRSAARTRARCTGTWSRTSGAAVGSSWTARSSRQAGPGSSSPVPGTVPVRRRVALATCAEIPDGDEDFPALIGELAARGVAADAVVWDDRNVDWPGYDLVLPVRPGTTPSAGTSSSRWARSLPRILNPLPLLEWNTDKQRYLTDLAAAGVPAVPTVFVDPGAELEPPDGPFVVKPAVSAGGRRSARFERGEIDAARELVGRIHAEGRTAMVQPYLGDAVEVGLVSIDGRYSHAVRRRVPLPQAGEREVLYLDEQLDPAEATPANAPSPTPHWPAPAPISSTPEST